MKLLLLLGGLLGFSIGLLFSWAEEGSGSTCLFHACVAAYLTAILMRWWGSAWRKSLAESWHERQSRAFSSSRVSKAIK